MILWVPAPMGALVYVDFPLALSVPVARTVEPSKKVAVPVANRRRTGSRPRWR